MVGKRVGAVGAIVITPDLYKHLAFDAIPTTNNAFVFVTDAGRDFVDGAKWCVSALVIVVALLDDYNTAICVVVACRPMAVERNVKRPFLVMGDKMEEE